MAPRPYWKGHLRLSLVNCPIVLYSTATQAERTHFHMINKETGNRLHQQMVDEQTGEVVEKENKGRGYELSKGKYVEIEPEELEAIQLESTRTIDIDIFVPSEEIDKRYHDRAYYIAPDGKTGVEAFAVIRDAMKNKDRVALARIVLAHREHVIALEPFGRGLLGTTLRYDYEVKDEKQFFSGIPSPKIAKDMVELASHILDKKAGHFDARKFKDQYETALKSLVRRKAKGHTIEVPEPEPPPSNVINLMEALRQSVQGSKRAKPGRASGRTRARAGSTKKRTRRKAA
jgi:DNA end-binding protein Ku